MKVRLYIPPMSKRRQGWSRIVGQVKNVLNSTLVIEVGCDPAQQSIGLSRAAVRDDVV